MNFPTHPKQFIEIEENVPSFELVENELIRSIDFTEILWKNETLIISCGILH